MTLALVFGILGAVAQPTGPLQFKCSLSGASGGVQVAVASASSVPIAAEVHIALTLEPSQPSSGVETGYWAPVDLETGRPYGANEPRHLRLQPGQTIKGVLAPAKLSWAKRISAVWPDQPLRDAVPNGRYIMHLEIDGPGDGRQTRSNGLAVVVDKGILEILAKQP